jgi:glycosyltransferase involved in cell wall biosynthesis
MEKVLLLIPAFNPLRPIVQYVTRCLEELSPAIEHVIIVNDGSDVMYDSIFAELAQIKNCTVLVHDKNKGKGRALKTGFEFIIKKQWKAEGVVTVGAHNQHSILDVEQIIKSKIIFSDGIILGVREFALGKMPLKNYVGNQAASYLFQMLFHKRLLDIQTGLRYFPKECLFWMRNVPGETFSYDTNMLVAALHKKIPIYEVPVGEAKLKKNSIVYYDEVVDPSKIFHQIWRNFIRKTS